ncbi:MAG: hypothetical protein HKN26_05630 [Acidimicrobiales bacterium]|nr:hypothetical protein [Acidimicrobiales bacterium]
MPEVRGGKSAGEGRARAGRPGSLLALVVLTAVMAACTSGARTEPRTLKDRTAEACGSMVAVWDGGGRNQVQFEYQDDLALLVDGLEFELPDAAWVVRHVQGAGLNQCPQAADVEINGNPDWRSTSTHTIEATGTLRVEQEDGPALDMVFIGVSVYPPVGEPIEFGNQAYTDLVLADGS